MDKKTVGNWNYIRLSNAEVENTTELQKIFVSLMGKELMPDLGFPGLHQLTFLGVMGWKIKRIKQINKENSYQGVVIVEHRWFGHYHILPQNAWNIEPYK